MVELLVGTTLGSQRLAHLGTTSDDDSEMVALQQSREERVLNDDVDRVVCDLAGDGSR